MLNTIRIASPCGTSWEKMAGDDKIRFCQDCKLDVHNVSAMTKEEAAKLFKRRKEGERLCIRLYRRVDGTVLTQDCPRGLKLLRQRWNRTWQKLAAVAIWMLSFSSAVKAKDEAQLPVSDTVSDSVPAAMPAAEPAASVPAPRRLASQRQLLVTPILPLNHTDPQEKEGYVMGAFDYDYSAYMESVQRSILCKWSRPPREYNWSKNIVVTFTVYQNGSISNLKLTHSCGHQSFDEACIDAVRTATPFRALPGDNRDAEVQFTFDRKLANTSTKEQLLDPKSPKLPTRTSALDAPRSTTKRRPLFKASIVRIEYDTESD